MAFLLGVELSNKDKRKMVEKYKKKHDDYWSSRHLIQRSLTDFAPDCISYHEVEWAEPGFRLMPKL